MRSKRFAITLALAAALFAQNPDVDLQRAMQQETVTGDLKAAIEEYRKIVARAGSNRAVAAQALVHMAECYQKMGDIEARKIYEQVLREYGDQKEAVTTARARLGGSAHPGQPTTTLVGSGNLALFRSRVSPDGRYLSYTDWDSGDLVLHEIATGTDRRLTDTKQKKPHVNLFAEGSAISRDGKQIAYNWYENNKAELRLASLSGNPTPRRLYDNPDIDYFAPCDWSPDGKWLAVQVFRKDKTQQIGLVSIQEGSLHVLKSIDWRGTRAMFFSPDGKYLGYDLPESDTSSKHDVFVLSIDGTSEIPAVAHRGEDLMMGWSPDGKRLLFASDRSGAMDLWSLSFADGKPQGAPELLKADIGRVAQSKGVTRSGALYYMTMTGGDQASVIHVAEFDFAAGRRISPGTEVTHDYLESNRGFRWSPDGKYLAYVSQRVGPGPMIVKSQPPPGDTLVIRSAETYEVVRQWRGKLSYFYGYTLLWMPDGRSVLVRGADFMGRQGVFQIDTQNGDVSSIRIDQPGGPRVNYFSVSPDGRSLYYSQSTPGEKESTLIQRDLASGSEKELMRGLALAAGSVSPDGRYLAVGSFDPASGSTTEVFLPIAGGERRELRVPTRVIPACWARDSRSFFAFKPPTDPQFGGENWRVPIDGGVPVKMEGVPGCNAHPDGRIAYTDSETLPQKQEVWVLENLLPTTTGSR